MVFDCCCSRKHKNKFNGYRPSARGPVRYFRKYSDLPPIELDSIKEVSEEKSRTREFEITSPYFGQDYEIKEESEQSEPEIEEKVEIFEDKFNKLKFRR